MADMCQGADTTELPPKLVKAFIVTFLDRINYFVL